MNNRTKNQRLKALKPKVVFETDRQDGLIQQKMVELSKIQYTRGKTQEELAAIFYKKVLDYTKDPARALRWRDEYRTLLRRGGSLQPLADTRGPLSGGGFSPR